MLLFTHAFVRCDSLLHYISSFAQQDAQVIAVHETPGYQPPPEKPPTCWETFKVAFHYQFYPECSGYIYLSISSLWTDMFCDCARDCFEFS